MNYPDGTMYDPRAPWNEKENPPYKIDIKVYQTLSKNTSIYTSDYFIEDDYVDIEHCNLEATYADQEMSALDILNYTSDFLKSILGKLNKSETVIANTIIDACKGWENELTEVEVE